MHKHGHQSLQFYQLCEQANHPTPAKSSENQPHCLQKTDSWPRGWKQHWTEGEAWVQAAPGNYGSSGDKMAALVRDITGLVAENNSNR